MSSRSPPKSKQLKMKKTRDLEPEDLCYGKLNGVLSGTKSRISSEEAPVKTFTSYIGLGEVMDESIRMKTEQTFRTAVMNRSVVVDKFSRSDPKRAKPVGGKAPFSTKKAISKIEGRKKKISSNLPPAEESMRTSKPSKPCASSRAQSLADAMALHELWKGYCCEILSQKSPSEMREAIMGTLDLHGALVEVSKSLNPSNVGLKGVVVEETQSSFLIVSTKDGSEKRLPKRVMNFQLEVFQSDLSRTKRKAEGSAPSSSLRVGLFGPSLVGRGGSVPSKQDKSVKKASTTCVKHFDLKRF